MKDKTSKVPAVPEIRQFHEVMIQHSLTRKEVMNEVNKGTIIGFIDGEKVRKSCGCGFPLPERSPGYGAIDMCDKCYIEFLKWAEDKYGKI